MVYYERSFGAYKGGDIPVTTDEGMSTTDELAQWLKVDRRTVATLAAEKQIPYYQVGRKLRFLRAEVAAALRKDTPVQPEGQPPSAP